MRAEEFVGRMPSVGRSPLLFARRGLLAMCATVTLVCSACVNGGDESIGRWNAATSCGDVEAFRAAVDQVIEVERNLQNQQLGELGEVACGDFDDQVTAIVVARVGDPLMNQLDG